MKYFLYSLENEVGTYYGLTTNIKRRMEKHKHKSNTCASKLLFKGKTEPTLTIHETYDDADEARLSEANMINYFDCVNVGTEARAVIDKNFDTKNQYYKQYKKINNDIFNKRGVCGICGKTMIDRNIPRHQLKCKSV